MPPAAEFSLSIISLTPPDLPPPPPDATEKTIKSPLIPHAASATSPLLITISLPPGREKDPLWPATHLTTSVHWDNSGSVYQPDQITSKDLIKSDDGDDPDAKIFTIEIPPKRVPRAKVDEGTSGDAEIKLYAWKNERLLGQYDAGTIRGLGLIGFKASEISLRRQEVRDAAKAKKAAEQAA